MPKSLNFTLWVKESKGSRVKQCHSKYGPQISASQHVACSRSVIRTGTKGVNVYKLLKPFDISMTSRHAISEFN